LSIISLTCDILRSNFSTQPAYIVQIIHSIEFSYSFSNSFVIVFTQSHKFQRTFYNRKRSFEFMSCIMNKLFHLIHIFLHRSKSIIYESGTYEVNTKRKENSSREIHKDIYKYTLQSHSGFYEKYCTDFLGNGSTEKKIFRIVDIERYLSILYFRLYSL